MGRADFLPPGAQALACGPRWTQRFSFMAAIVAVSLSVFSAARVSAQDLQAPPPDTPAAEQGMPAPSAPPDQDRATSLPPPTGLQGRDVPNDRGEKIVLTWQPGAEVNDTQSGVTGYAIERAKSAQGPFHSVGLVPLGDVEFTDQDTLVDGTGYYYRIRLANLSGPVGEPTAVAGPVFSQGQWFDRTKAPTLLLTFLFSLAVVVLISLARRGRSFYVRPIPGLSAVDEAIGRATEMGRPILFVCGLGSAGDVATLAAFTLLGRVARKTAEYQTRALVPCYDPIVMTVCQEIVKSSYLDAGRPELYRQDDIYFVTQDQFPYTAAVNGVMLREKPATNFYIGKFYAESLVLAETGNVAGSIQIAGTDEITQIPFFVATCDYTLIGEELYASSAYLSQEPPLLGTLKAQDFGKAAAAFIMLGGAILAALNQGWFVNFFRVQ